MTHFDEILKTGKTDKIVEQVIENFKNRSKIGIQKYGTTLNENNSDDFLNHLQEELMDATLYIQKLKQQTTYPLLKVKNLKIKSNVLNLEFPDLKEVNLIYNHNGTELIIEIK